jgi:hypothetical protein
MKKLYTFLIAIILCIGIANAQTPQGFKYQAVVRDNSGLALANKLVAIRLSLLLNSTNGTSIYSEVHNIATNDFGVANLNVGSGTNTTGNFANIDWGAGTYFLKTEADITNGSNFVFLGTSQLLSVPYAMYAAKSANAANDFDKDSLNEIQNISLNGNNLQLNKNGGSIDLTKYTTDIDTDSQSLSLKGHTLSITRGNNIQLNDIDSLNEIQNLTLTNNNLQLNKNGGSVDLTKYDKDSQQLVLNGNTLSITKGNTIVLSGAVDLDSDPTNEIQNLSIKKDTISISRANYILLPKDNDTDSTNEIQMLSVNQNKLSISKSNQVNIDADTTNEIQSLLFTNDTLKISKNNSVVVPGYNTVQSSKLLYANAIGTNVINLTLPNNISSYTAGMMINFKAQSNNTGAVYVNINGLGNKAVLKNISDTLIANDFRINQMVSIIYDGSNFQILVSPYSRISEKANILNSDSLGGLVPKNSLILSEINSAPVGYVATGQKQTNPANFELVNSEYDINIINPYNIYQRAINYIGSYSGKFVFLLALDDSIKILSFDTTNKSWSTIGISKIGICTPVNGLENYYAKINSNSIYIIYTYACPNNPGYTLYPIYLMVKEFSFITNTWNTLYNYSLGMQNGFVYRNNLQLTGYDIINNSIYFDLKGLPDNTLLNNRGDDSSFYKFNINMTNLSRVYINSGYQKKSINNSIYIGKTNEVHDSIFLLSFNDQLQFVARNPMRKYGTSNFTIGNNWFIGEYRFNSISQNFTLRNDYASIKENNNGIQYGKNMYLCNNSDSSIYLGDTINYKFIKVEIDPSSIFLGVEKFFAPNNDYIYCFGSGVISKMYYPKIYYYFRKQ